MELSTLQVSNISHFFFPLQAQSHMKNSGGEKTKTKHLSFFPLLSQKRWVERELRVEVGKKGQHSKLQKVEFKKKIQTK